MSRKHTTPSSRNDATTAPAGRESAAETRKKVADVLAFLESGDAPPFIKTAIREVIIAAARGANITISFDSPSYPLHQRLYSVFRAYRPDFDLRATGYINRGLVECERQESAPIADESPARPDNADQLSSLRAQLARLDLLPENEATRFQLETQIARLEREQACDEATDEWAGFDVLDA